MSLFVVVFACPSWISVIKYHHYTLVQLIQFISDVEGPANANNILWICHAISSILLVLES